MDFRVFGFFSRPPPIGTQVLTIMRSSSKKRGTHPQFCYRIRNRITACSGPARPVRKLDILAHVHLNWVKRQYLLGYKYNQFWEFQRISWININGYTNVLFHGSPHLSLNSKGAPKVWGCWAVEDIRSQIKELPCKRGIPVNDFNDCNCSIGILREDLKGKIIHQESIHFFLLCCW